MPCRSFRMTATMACIFFLPRDTSCAKNSRAPRSWRIAVIAFMYKIVAVDPRSVTEAKRWIGRIVFGTIGVEIAGTLTHAIIASIPASAH